MKKLLVTLWLTLLFTAVGAMFWYNELKYHLPTPIPGNYKPVSTGTLIKLNGAIKYDHSKPLFLHFFNPECACSRFNVPQFQALVKQFGQQVNFVVVVINDNSTSLKKIQSKLGLNIPVSFDVSLAAACGVYSTPQAVLLDTAHKLYYRGNYNKGRYCVDEKTNYAKIAIAALLQGYSSQPFSPLALRAYGCELISCGKQSISK